MASSSSAPKAKKAKPSTDSPADEQFYNPETPHDRVLLVEGKKFYVDSNALISCSEYFRAIFTGGFQEENKQEITLENVSAIELEKFLVAVTTPEDVYWTGEVLLDLVVTCSYFQAEALIMKVLDVRSNFERLSKEDILYVSSTNGLMDLKNSTELSLIKTSEGLKDGDKKDKIIQTGIDYQLDKLLDFMADTISINYGKCEQVLTKYKEKDNEFFRKRIEVVENSLIQTFTEDESAFFFHKQRAKREEYIMKFIFDYNLLKLKAFVNNFFKREFENRTGRYIYLTEYALDYYHLQEFKEYLVNKFKGLRGHDPLLAENKEVIPKLSEEAQAFILESMLKD